MRITFRRNVIMKKIRSVAFITLMMATVFNFSGCFLIENKIIELDQNVEEAQSNIATQYDNKLRRIPELLSTVKASKNAEIEAMIGTIEARAQAAGQIKLDANTISNPEQMEKFQEAQAELNAGLGRLLAVSEQYPDFKFPDQFTNLMTEIEGANNRITVAQTRYNKAVKEFNTYILSFPGKLCAKDYPKKVMFQMDNVDVTKPVGAMELDFN